MNRHVSRRVLRMWTFLFLAAGLTLGGCERSEEAAPAALEQKAAAQPASAPTAPVVQGLGGSTTNSAISDTIDLRQIGYARGAVDAPVVVYEFSDFGCPYCGKFALDTYPELHKDFVVTGKVRWTYVPFVMGMFPNGAQAARAAECAAEQDSFWEMHDLLYARQQDWKSSRSPAELFNDYGRDLGLDAGRFASCYREDRGRARTAINNQAADALRVRATPSFFINGRLVEGALPAEQFQQILTILSEQ